ncbi:acyl-lipid (8-3)-desaturase [Folsomia candida]|uniref:acyl-lipid (8-3)-desaturase n=1 Tax=Folsomia candida TaxID=158441 RepID=UPI001604E05E|nr:acyl-lipid (8-3)-desaturase [Folsomia candida]
MPPSRFSSSITDKLYIFKNNSCYFFVLIFFYNKSMKRVLRFRNALPFRRDSEEDCEREPSKTEKRNNKALNERFKLLHAEFDQAGLFNPSLSHVLSRIAEFSLYLFLAWVILANCEFSACRRILGIFMLTMAYGRIVWLAHEGGHYSLTGRPRVDSYLQKFLYGFGNGLSASWWNHNHHRHHAMPQRIHRDVDLDTLPLLAFSKKCFSNQNLQSAKNFFIKYQAILFLPVHTFIVTIRWSLYLHPQYCYRKGQFFEIFCISLHFLFALTNFGILNFLMAKWLWSMYMFGNFSISHTHLEVTAEPQHWVEYAFHNTINVKSTPFMDWWMGWLNFQIEHHLFPTMPQFRSPLIKKRVKKFAEENGLPYKEFGYFEAFKATLKNLRDVAKEH